MDTDSPEIISGLQEVFPDVRSLFPSLKIRADNVPMNEILIYDVSQAPADLYLQTHSTNPLLEHSTISKAINTLLKTDAGKRLIVFGNRLQTRLYDAKGNAINHDPRKFYFKHRILPPVYEENSCIYLFTAESLRKNKTRIGANPILFETDPDESWDIDEEIDFKMVELMLKARRGN